MWITDVNAKNQRQPGSAGNCPETALAGRKTGAATAGGTTSPGWDGSVAIMGTNPDPPNEI